MNKFLKKWEQIFNILKWRNQHSEIYDLVIYFFGFKEKFVSYKGQFLYVLDIFKVSVF